jgi:carbon starvation protein CstA
MEIPFRINFNQHASKRPSLLPRNIFNDLCGALSGFHATQSPIIARTIRNEKDGRKIFYGMMIVEGVIAMIWAAAAMSLMNGEDLSVLPQEGLPDST